MKMASPSGGAIFSLVGKLVSEVGVHVVPDIDASPFGVVDEARAYLLQRREEFHALVEVVGSVLQQSLKLFRILAREHRQSACRQRHSYRPPPRQNQERASADRSEYHCFLPALHVHLDIL